MNADIRLKKPQIDALLEIYQSKTDFFCKRVASMRKLAFLGYVERAGGTDRSPAWRMTSSGRDMAEKCRNALNRKD